MTSVTCSVEGCTKDYLAKGYCRMHYSRVRRGKDPGTAEEQNTRVEPREDGLCAAPDCTESRYGTRSYCNTHYFRMYRFGSLDEREKVKNKNFVDITGMRFGTLVAVSHETGIGYWNLQCDCGKIRRTRYNNLMSERDSTCGDTKVHTIRESTQPSYDAAHRHVTRVKGRASDYECICGSPAKQWSYNHEDPSEYFVVGYSKNPVPYSMLPEYYTPRCVPCHKKEDLDYIKKMV